MVQRAEARAGRLRTLDNFDVALTQFEVDMKAGRTNVRVARRDGASRGGGGGLDMLLFMTVAPLRFWQSGALRLSVRRLAN